jgi:hypothetical protein
VLTVITAQLEVLESRSGAQERRITELLIDTGRRPDEACVLVWDCLQCGHDDKPTLIYTDSKNNRPGRRLPIAGAHPIRTRVMAALRNLAIGALRLAGRADIAEATGWASRRADRPLTILESQPDLETTVRRTRHSTTPGTVTGPASSCPSAPDRLRP